MDKKGNIVDKFYKENKELFYMVFGSCISSSALRTVEDCEDALKLLTEIKEDLDSSKLVDEKTKKEWSELCEEGFAIINRDKKEMEENGGRRSAC